MQTPTDREWVGRETMSHVETRPTWSAALAGAVIILAIAILLWGLAVAIVAAISQPFVSFHDSVVTLWICAIVVTLIGAVAGGYAAGYLSRDWRPGLGAMNGFLAWAVALLAAFLVQFSVAKTLWTTVADSTPETTMGETMQMPGAADVPSAAPAPGDFARPPHPHEHLIALSWSWFGTWFLSAILATVAGSAGARSLRRGRPSTIGPTTYSPDVGPGAPFTPAPTR